MFHLSHDNLLVIEPCFHDEESEGALRACCRQEGYESSFSPDVFSNSVQDYINVCFICEELEYGKPLLDISVLYTDCAWEPLINTIYSYVVKITLDQTSTTDNSHHTIKKACEHYHPPLCAPSYL